MRWLNWTLLAAAALLLGGGALTAQDASALNDCCYDWAPNEVGVNDPPGPGKGLVGAKQWALCVAATGPKPCFNRHGRQLYKQNRECIIGSDDVVGAAVGNLPPVDAGYQCELKTGGSFTVQVAGKNPSGLLEAALSLVPALSPLGLGALVALMGSGALWMIRRRRSPTSQA